MKARKPITILLFSLFVTLTIFSQTNPVLNYLPKDAKVIIKLNAATLGQKIKWEELIQHKMFQDLMKDMPEEGKDFFKDPRQTGIELSQGIFVIVPPGKNNEKQDPVFYATVKDTAQIAAMVKKLFKGKKPVKAPNGKLIIDKHTALSWNNEIVILTGDDAKKESSLQKAKTNASTESIRLKQLSDRCKLLLSKNAKAPVNEYFTALMNEQGDLLLWTNNTQSQMQKKDKMPAALGILNKNFMRSGDYTSAIINFENGKVVAQMKRYVSSSLDSIYKKYPSRNINTELVKKLPAGHPILLGSFNFSPDMLSEIFTRAGVNKYLDSVSKHKVKMEDISSAVKGDVTLAGMKVYEFTEDDSVTQALNGIQVFLTGHIHDKEKFKNLVAQLEKKNEDTTRYRPKKGMKPSILSNDSIFVLSISPIAAQKFLDSPGNNDEIEKLISPYKEHPSAFVLDLKTIFGIALQTLSKGKSSEDTKQTSEALGLFDKLIAFGGEYSNKASSSTVELTFTNKDENSLKQFLNLIDLFNSYRPKKSTALK